MVLSPAQAESKLCPLPHPASALSATSPQRLERGMNIWVTIRVAFIHVRLSLGMLVICLCDFG